MIRSRMSPAVTGLIATLSVAFAPALSQAQGGSSPLVPPQSRAFGKSIEEWSVLQTQYAIAADLGDATVSDTVGRVRLLPSSFSPDPIVEFDVTLPPGTPFAATPYFVFGERYDDPGVPDDDPDDPFLASFLEEIFSTTHVQLTLDGQVVLAGGGRELDPFLIGPTYYDEPIVYANPIPRPGPPNAVAALWVMGFGAVFRPLPPGEHTLVVTVQSIFPNNYEYTYHITVEK